MIFDLCSFLLGGLLFWLLGWLLDWYFGRDKQAQNDAVLLDLRGKLESAGREHTQLETELTGKLGLLGNLEQEHSALKARIPKLEGFEQVNADLRLQMQGFDAVKQKLETAEAELHGLRLKAGEFDGLHTKLETTQQELSSLKTRTAGFDGFVSKAALVGDLEAKLSELEAEKAKQLAELNQMAIKVSDAEHAQQKLRGSLDESVGEISRLRSGVQAFAGLQKRIEDLEKSGVSQEAQNKIDALETELSASRERIVQLEANLQTQNANFEQQALDGLRTELESLKVNHGQEILDLRGQFETGVQEKDNQIQALRGQLESASYEKDNQINALRGQLEAAHQAKDAEINALRGQLETHSLDKDNEINSLRAQLEAANHGKVSELASLQAQLREQHESAKAEQERQNQQHAEHQTQIASLREKVAMLEAELTAKSEQPDKLVDINGIGQTIAQKLEAAGIRRFSQLAEASPEQVREIVQPKEFQKFDFAAWIEDAGYFARGQTPPTREKQVEVKFSKIDGIGEVTDTKLKAAGIKTYAELASANNQTIDAALGHQTDPDELELWKAQAEALAIGKSMSDARERVRRSQLERRESEMRRLQTELRQAESLRRDRFDLITSIGDAMMRKLYGAGIYLYSELAQTDNQTLKNALERDDLDFDLIRREAATFASGSAVVSSSETVVSSSGETVVSSQETAEITKENT